MAVSRSQMGSQMEGSRMSLTTKGKKTKKTKKATGGEPWKKDNPKPKSKRKSLSSSQKSRAKAMAKKGGRPYPNLVDNMRAAKSRRT